MIERLLPALALALLPSVALSGIAQEPLAEEVEAALDRALAEPVTGAGWEDVYRVTILEYGNLTPVFEALDAHAETAPRAAHGLRLRLLMRRGDLDTALAAAESILEVDGADLVALEHKARLLDARNKADEALAAYAALLAHEVDAELELEVRLRMALLEGEQDPSEATEATEATGGRATASAPLRAATEGPPEPDPEEQAQDALLAFATAEGRDTDVRNRAATVLALLGRPEDAIDLFVIEGDGSKRFRQEIRVAEWALHADDLDKAKEMAWAARESARLDRDRYYAITVLLEAHRKAETLEALVDALAAEEELDRPSKEAWIALLRETGQLDEAIELLRDSAGSERLEVPLRRQLLEMYREADREDDMIAAYRELIANEPERVEWPEGLSRFYLERGDEASAQEVWEPWLDATPPGGLLLAAADSLMGMGQDTMAVACAERCIADGRSAYSAYLFLFDLHRNRGQLDDARDSLERMEAAAPPEAAERLQLAEAFEMLGDLDRAVDVLEGVRGIRGAEESGEDLEMRLAWLHSEVGNEEIALERWRELWRRVNSIPRRRYVEDRLMAVASRLGLLADVAIELEEKLIAGTADDRDAGLLVRLYTKVGDPVSATEILEEHMRRSGGSAIDALQEKARVFLSCTDYHNYEKSVRELIELDPEGEADYLRQLAMSMLERGKPDEARSILGRLSELESAADTAEFEAGVLALGGLRQEAIQAYRRGIAGHPDRIESFLLLANLLREVGEQWRAVGMFQHLAETAEKDDLFTVAIDGLLNMEADEEVVDWARRLVLARLASRHDRMYLYQLLADLAEQADDRNGQYVAMENSLPIAGDRRPAILRELMDLAHGGPPGFGRPSRSAETERHLAYGRRLIGLDQIVPPQVYLDLGRAFLSGGDVENASKTFGLATDLPDPMIFLRDTAELFEQNRYAEEALRTYERVLLGNSGDVGLLVKVGELHEQLGADELARDLYGRGIELLLSRLSELVTLEEDGVTDVSDPFTWYGAKNVDDFDRYYARLLRGLLVTLPETAAEAWLQAERGRIDAELAKAEELGLADSLRRHPRLLRRAELYRRVSGAYGMQQLADALDHQLLARFGDDDRLLEDLVQERLRWGRIGSARALLAASGRSDEETRRLRFLVGEGVEASATELVPFEQVMGLFLPLLAEGRDEEARDLLRRVDYADLPDERVSDMGALLSAAVYVQDPGLALQLGRQWLRLQMKERAFSYQVEQTIGRARLALTPELRRGLYQYFAQLVLEDPEKRGECVRLLPDLQEELGETLLDEEQILELVEENASRLYFGLGPVLELLPAESRASVVRSVWPDVVATMRTHFVLRIVEEMKEPIDSELQAVLVESFRDALGEKTNFSFYPLINVMNSPQAKLHGDTVLALLEVMLEDDPDSLLAQSLQAVVYARLDRAEEGAELAAELYLEKLDSSDRTYEMNQARRLLEEAYLPEQLDSFLARLDAEDASSGPDLERTNRRLQLVATLRDPQRMLEETRRAAERHPEEESLQQRLRRALQSAGERREALAMLERMSAEKPEDLNLARERYGQWSSRKHSIRALDAWIDAYGEEETQAEEGDGPPAEQSELAAMIASGQIVLSASQLADLGYAHLVVDDEEDDGRLKRPTIQRVKEQLEAGELSSARTELRRLWRTYPQANDRNRGVVYFSSSRGRGPRLRWPADEQEEDATEDEAEEQEETEEERARKRGGLALYEEEPPEPREPRPSAWTVLSEHPFGVAEIRGQVRVQESVAIDGLGEVLNGLIHARELEAGPEGAIEALLAQVHAGEAGKLEYVQLLALLEEHPDSFDDRARAVLGDLARSLNPRDGTQLRRLAKVYAAIDDRVNAVRMFRWCSTLCNASRYFSLRGEAYGNIPAHELVEEVKEALGPGEDTEAVIESILMISTPSGNEWERRSYENLALDTWIEFLGPARALERCAEICAEADARDVTLRRDVAKKAAWIYAASGDVERTVACLEAALCRMAPSDFMGDYGPSRQAEYPGHVGYDGYRNFFPSEPEGWADPVPVWRAVGNALAGWLEKDLVQEGDAFRAACLAALRLHEHGAIADAAALRARLEGVQHEDASAWLWLADVCREAGDGAGADRVERALFARGSLHVQRVPELARRIFEQDGADAALAMIREAAEDSLHPALLDVAVEAAEAASDPFALAQWRAIRSFAASSQVTLERLIEEREARLEAEAEAAKAAGTAPRGPAAASIRPAVRLRVP